MLKQINNIKPIITIDEEHKKAYGTIHFNGLFYEADASLHHDDEGFFSPKVGTYIVTAKIKIQILQDLLIKTEKEWKQKRAMYLEVIRQKDIDSVDPTGAFLNNVERACNRCKVINRALKNEKNKLKNYLKAQEKVIAIVRHTREKAKVDTN